MLYRKFHIKHFRGISEATIDLTKNAIVTLVGLNESGKTTVMQAIALFYRCIKRGVPSKVEINKLRPKGIGFTGSIEIRGELEFEEDDIKQIQDYWNGELNKRKTLEVNKKFEYTYRFNFKEHEYVNEERLCVFDIKPKGSKQSVLQSDKDTWNKLIVFVKTNIIPEILYYEDFVFQIPDQIKFGIPKLEKQPDGTSKTVYPDNDDLEEPLNETWQLVLDDVLKAVKPEQDSFQAYVADIWKTDGETAKNRLSQMKRVLNEKITKAWKELFGKGNKKLNFKEISLQTEEKDNLLNVSFAVETDTGHVFSINDRSKGCKWFFSFLLFTEFRKTRTHNTLFLLDEPASNLHSSAQLKILNAINELSVGSMVIYSTHSHHLINVDWLSGAYVIINEVITDEMLAGDMVLEDQAKIKAQRFYDYVGQGVSQDKVSYFQPILDALDYQPSYVETVPNLVILEGRNDWYVYKYFQQIILKDKRSFNFYPGKGRGTLFDIINLYLAWGRDFIVLLDGDAPGQDSAINYQEKFPGFLDRKIYTIKDALSLEASIEGLISMEDQKLIFDNVYGEGKFDEARSETKQFKTDLNNAITKLLIQKKALTLSSETKNKFKTLFDYIWEKKPKSNDE